jgi:hypothetical protein
MGRLTTQKIARRAIAAQRRSRAEDAQDAEAEGGS